MGKSLFKRIDHIEIVSPDLQRSVDFYKRLGPIVRTTPHHDRSVEILIGSTLFEIHEVGAGGNTEENPGIDHMSFLVEGGKEELDEAREELVKKGIDCSEVVYIKQSGRYLFNFRDDSGRRLQANTSPPDTEETG
jgi:catechol 2,3-dioxygenase-like lactoylglutathione lyase family enzyme